MKSSILTICLAMAINAGCSTPHITRFEYGDIKVEVSGKTTAPKTATSAVQVPGLYLMADAGARQITIEAKLVEVSNHDISIMGLNWITPEGRLLEPTTIKDSTPEPPSFGLGLGFISGGRSRGHDGSCHCSKGGDDSGSGVGMGFNIPLRSSRQTTSVSARFNVPGSIEIDFSVVMLKILEKKSGDLSIVRPLILPVRIMPELKPDEKLPTLPTSLVTVRDGKALKFGGLKTDEATARKEVPLLGDLPMLGRLFKDDKNVRHTETVIYITPRIILMEE